MERGEEYRAYRAGDRIQDSNAPFRGERGEFPGYKRDRPGNRFDARMGAGGGGRDGTWEPFEQPPPHGYIPSSKRGRFDDRPPAREFHAPQGYDGRREFAAGRGVWRGADLPMRGRGRGRFGPRGGFAGAERGRHNAPLPWERGSRGPAGYEGEWEDYGAGSRRDFIPLDRDRTAERHGGREGRGTPGEYRDHVREAPPDVEGGTPSMGRVYVEPPPPPPPCRRRQSPGSRSTSRERRPAPGVALDRPDHQRHNSASFHLPGRTGPSSRPGIVPGAKEGGHAPAAAAEWLHRAKSTSPRGAASASPPRDSRDLDRGTALANGKPAPAAAAPHLESEQLRLVGRGGGVTSPPHAADTSGGPGVGGAAPTRFAPVSHASGGSLPGSPVSTSSLPAAVPALAAPAGPPSEQLPAGPGGVQQPAEGAVLREAAACEDPPSRSPFAAPPPALTSASPAQADTSTGDAAQHAQQQGRRRLGWGQGLARLKSTGAATSHKEPGSPSATPLTSPMPTSLSAHPSQTGDPSPPAPAPLSPPSRPELQDGELPQSPHQAEGSEAKLRSPSAAAAGPGTEPGAGLRIRTTPPPPTTAAQDPPTPSSQPVPQVDGQGGADVDGRGARLEEGQGEGGRGGEEEECSKEDMVGRIEALDQEIGELEKLLAELRGEQQRQAKAEAKLQKSLSKLEQRRVKPLPPWTGSDVSDVPLSSTSESESELSGPPSSQAISDEEMADAGGLPSPSASSTRRAGSQLGGSRTPGRRRASSQLEAMEIDSGRASEEEPLGPAQQAARRVVQSAVSALAAEAACLLVMRQNKHKARSAHAELGALAPRELLERAGSQWVPAGRPVFADVSQVPQYQANAERHARNGVGVRALLGREFGAQLRRHVALAVEYRERAEQYREQAEQHARTRGHQAAALEPPRRSHSALSGDKSGMPQQAQRDPLASPLARSSSRARSGDIVRSDYEEKQAIATLQAIELVKHMAELPTQQRPSRRAARWAALLDVSRRVADPVRELEERDWVRPWSEEEKRVFCDKFLLYHKEFPKIQAYLPQRTVQEVISLYYAIQHTDEFAHTRRKYLLRKRREQADANSRRKSQDSVMGMSIADPSAFNPNPAPVTVQRSRSFSGAEQLPGEGGRGGRGVRSRSRGGGAHHGGAVGGVPGVVSAPPVLPNPVHPAPPLPATTGRRASRHRAAVVEPLLFAAAAPAAESSGGGGTRRTRQAGAVRDYAAMENADWDGGDAEDGAPVDRRHDPVADALFVEAVQLYGKDMKSIARHVGNKTLAATRLYWSRHRARLQLDDILEERAAQGLDQEAYFPQGGDAAAAASDSDLHAPRGEAEGRAPRERPPSAAASERDPSAASGAAWQQRQQYSPAVQRDLEELHALLQQMAAAAAGRGAAVGHPLVTAAAPAPGGAHPAPHPPEERPSSAEPSPAGPACLAEEGGNGKGGAEEGRGPEAEAEAAQRALVAGMVAAALRNARWRETPDGEVAAELAAVAFAAVLGSGTEGGGELVDAAVAAAPAASGRLEAQQAAAASMAATAAAAPGTGDVLHSAASVTPAMPADPSQGSAAVATPTLLLPPAPAAAAQQEAPPRSGSPLPAAQPAEEGRAVVKVEEGVGQQAEARGHTQQGQQAQRLESLDQGSPQQQPAPWSQTDLKDEAMPDAAPLSAGGADGGDQEGAKQAGEGQGDAPLAPPPMQPQEAKRLQQMLTAGGLLHDIIGDDARCADLRALLSTPERLLGHPNSVQALTAAVARARTEYSGWRSAAAEPSSEGGDAQPAAAEQQLLEGEGEEEGPPILPSSALGRRNPICWTEEEKEAFVQAYKAHGRIWSKLQAAVPSKSATQVKSFYQKYRTRLGLDRLPAVVGERVGGGGRKRKASGALADKSPDAAGSEPPARLERAQRRSYALTQLRDPSMPPQPQSQPPPPPQQQPHRPKALRPQAPQPVSVGHPLFRAPPGLQAFFTPPGMHPPPGTPLAGAPASAAMDPSGVLAQWVQRYNQSVAEMVSSHSHAPPPPQNQGLAAAAALYGMFGGGGLPPGAFMAAARAMQQQQQQQVPGASQLGGVSGAAMDPSTLAAALPLLGMVGVGPMQQAPHQASPAEQLARLLQGQAPLQPTPAPAPAASSQAAAALSMQLQAMLMTNPAAAAALMGGMQSGGIPPQLLLQAGMALRGGGVLHPSPQAMPPPPQQHLGPSIPASAAAIASQLSRSAAQQQQPAPTNLSSLLAAAALQQQQAQQAQAAGAGQVAQAEREGHSTAPTPPHQAGGPPPAPSSQAGGGGA